MRIKIVAGIEPVLIRGLDTTHLARVDTGAKTSSISVVETFLRKERLCFYVPDGSVERLFVAQEWTQKLVRTTTGEELRYFVHLGIKFAGQCFDTPFSLSTRNNMKYKILIGRSLLNNRFIVDTTKKVKS